MRSSGRAKTHAAERKRWVLNMINFPRIFALFFLLITASALSESSGTPVRVELGLQDTAGLIQALEAKGYEAALGNECCDQPLKEAEGVWIGEDISHEDVKRIVDLALSKYPHLRYYKFWGSEVPKEWRRIIYVGGSKWAAHNKTKPLGSNEARAAFGKVSSSQDLRRLIQSLQK